MSKDLALQDRRDIDLHSEEQKKFKLIEQVVIGGDLAKLSPQERVTYYHKVCESMRLNPYTKPFEYIQLGGKLTLYAKKDATEQLRKINGISITELEGKLVDDLYIVTATARTHDGRTDQATGAVTLGNLRGEQKANAIMKAETKAKRRVTLSVSGMGWCDESEIDSIPNAVPLNVNIETGEIKNTMLTQAEVLPPKVISAEKAQELTELLNECDPKFKERVLDFYRNRKINSFFELPISGYDELKIGILDNFNNYQQSLKPKDVEVI